MDFKEYAEARDEWKNVCLISGSLNLNEETIKQLYEFSRLGQMARGIGKAIPGALAGAMGGGFKQAMHTTAGEFNRGGQQARQSQAAGGKGAWGNLRQFGAVTGLTGAAAGLAHGAKRAGQEIWSGAKQAMQNPDVAGMQRAINSISNQQLQTKLINLIQSDPDLKKLIPQANPAMNTGMTFGKGY